MDRLKRLGYLESLSKYGDFEVQIEYPSGARSTLQKFSEVDKRELLNPNNILHRTMIANDSYIELVLDLDNEDWATNKIAFAFMLDDLEDKKIQTNNFFSGGKGWHIHCMFKYSLNINESEVQKYKQKLQNKYYKAIKTKILRYILLGKKSHHKDWYERYKMIDYQVLNHRHTIRCEGSKHHNPRHIGYKTLVTDICTNLDTLVLPDKIPLNKLKLRVSDELEQEINNNTTKYTKEYKSSAVGFKNIRQPIRKLLKARLLDGKKSAVFVISRELLNNGFDSNECIAVLCKWNNKQPTQLEEQYIVSQVKSAQNKKPVTQSFLNEQSFVFQ